MIVLCRPKRSIEPYTMIDRQVFMLDADVLSDLRKTRKNPVVQSWIERRDQAEISTSVITIAAIQCGIERQMAHHPDYAR